MSIRMAAEGDLQQLLAIYAPYVTNTTVSFEYEAPTPEEFSRRFHTVTAQFPWLVWEEEGRILGYAYAAAPFERAAYRWIAEPSIYLAPEAQGRGIGRALYAVLEDILQKQGYRVLYALITSENSRSLAFHKALGYCHLADFPRCAWKFGRELGVIWLEKRLSFVENSSIFPMPWYTVVEIDKFFRPVLDNVSLS